MSTTWMPSADSALAELRSRVAQRKLAAEPIDINTTVEIKKTSPSIPEAQELQDREPAQPWTPRLDARHGPMMPLDMMTYAQIGIFDNDDKPLECLDRKTGKTRKRQKELRFKVSIEAWCAPAHLIQKRGGAQFDRQVQLRSAIPFENKIVEVNAEKGTFGPTFVRELRDAIIAHPDDLFGVISETRALSDTSCKTVLNSSMNFKQLPKVS